MEFRCKRDVCRTRRIISTGYFRTLSYLKPNGALIPENRSSMPLKRYRSDSGAARVPGITLNPSLRRLSRDHCAFRLQPNNRVYGRRTIIMIIRVQPVTVTVPKSREATPRQSCSVRRAGGGLRIAFRKDFESMV